MADENKTRDAADAVRGIVEAVPIYQDLAQPALQELGKGLQTVAKTVHIALAPVAALVWGYDEIKEFVATKIAQRLAKVPPERIVTPAPNVAGPILEALRFTGHVESLREMYANLLASAMDSETKQDAHPAFVEIIKQMTPDEAKLFALISADKGPNAVVDIRIDSPGGGATVAVNLSTLGNQAKCDHPNLTPTYIDNFARLGLVRVISAASLVRGAYDWVDENALPNKLFKLGAKMKATVLKKGLEITTFGQHFAHICAGSRPSSPLTQMLQEQVMAKEPKKTSFHHSEAPKRK